MFHLWHVTSHYKQSHPTSIQSCKTADTTPSIMARPIRLHAYLGYSHKIPDQSYKTHWCVVEAVLGVVGIGTYGCGMVWHESMMQWCALDLYGCNQDPLAVLQDWRESECHPMLSPGLKWQSLLTQHWSPPILIGTVWYVASLMMIITTPWQSWHAT